MQFTDQKVTPGGQLLRYSQLSIDGNPRNGILYGNNMLVFSGSQICNAQFTTICLQNAFKLYKILQLVIAKS